MPKLTCKNWAQFREHTWFGFAYNDGLKKDTKEKLLWMDTLKLWKCPFNWMFSPNSLALTSLRRFDWIMSN